MPFTLAISKERTSFTKNRLLQLLTLLFFGYWINTLIYTTDINNWILENALVIIFLIFLLFLCVVPDLLNKKHKSKVYSIIAFRWKKSGKMWCFSRITWLDKKLPTSLWKLSTENMWTCIKLNRKWPLFWFTSRDAPIARSL